MFRKIALASMLAVGLSTATVASAAPPEPAPYQEVVPAAPGSGAVWVPGHWEWHTFQGRYEWQSGYWQAPSPTVVVRAPIVVGAHYRGHPWHRTVVVHRPVHKVVVVKHHR